MPASDAPSISPFYLIVADHDRGFFSVEGPMTDDRPWTAAARHARNSYRGKTTGTGIPCAPERQRPGK
jgi:hypothetical protein